MPHATSVAELSPLIRSRRALAQAGWRERDIDGEARGGLLHQIRRGWYIEAEQWARLWAEGKHLAHVIAVARDARSAVVMSHESAAVVWDLPLYRTKPGRVHVTTGSPLRISSGADVRRHIAPFSPGDTTVKDGLRVTTLARTVFDTIRTLRPEAAVAVADAAERLMAARGREWDQDALGSWRADIARRVDEASGARGIRQARWVVPFADGRAQLPGESVSRLQLTRIGFTALDLQVPVRAQGGGWYFVDFGMRAVDAFGEFDGKTKYLDEAKRHGLTVAEVLLAEKRREDWIRGTTQKRLARWGDEHIGSPAQLASRLAAFGIRPAA